MGFHIENKQEDYLKVIITGLMDRATVLGAMEALIHHPDFYDKHSYWDFTQAHVGISFEDIKQITRAMKHFKPERKTFANKSALLVSGKMTLAMANIFVALAVLLPFEYRAFSDPHKAEAYLSA